jgi:peptide alpha-N-acetyltransferase
MQYEDQLRSHPGYFRAALGAIDIYVRAHDDPTLGDEKLCESQFSARGVESALMSSCRGRGGAEEGGEEGAKGRAKGQEG